MKFVLAKEHRDFFTKKGWIEFEGVFSDTFIDQINEQIHLSIAHRLGTSSDQLHKYPSETLFLEGRDLWRDNAALMKLAAHPQLGSIVSDLFQKKTLRVGCQQFFPAKGVLLTERNQKKIYNHFLEQSTTLEEVMSVDELISGLIIALDDPSEETSALKDEHMIDPFPQKKGSVLFFRKDILLDWNRLFAHPKQRYCLIVHTEPTAFYKFNPKDPLTHTLKHLGYTFNARLTDKLHPIVYR